MASNKFEISLEGDASIFLPAERAVLKITVSNTAQDKQAVANDVISTVKKVEPLLRKLSPQSNTAEAKINAPVDTWTRTSMSETNHVPYDNEKRMNLPTEYTAEVAFDVHFQRFEAISGLINDLAALNHVKTRPLQWILLKKTQEDNRSALRIEAAKDAHRKALEYAQALGYKKVEPFHLREGNQYAGSTNMKRRMIYGDGNETRNSKKNMADVDAEEWEQVGGAVFEYAPEDVEMTAAVSASFYAM